MIFDKTKGFRHVLYEMKMFAHTTSSLMKVDSNNMTNDDYVYLESWTIHLRNFLCFFKDEGSFKNVNGKKVPNDDIMYFHYVPTNPILIEEVSKVPISLENINKYTAHLTYTRITEFPWSISPTYEIISKAFEIFLQELDSNYTIPYEQQINKIKRLVSKVKLELAQSNKSIDKVDQNSIIPALSTDSAISYPKMD